MLLPEQERKIGLYSSCIYICVFFPLDVDFEMLKCSHMEKIRHFVVYACECVKNLIYNAKLIQPTCSEVLSFTEMYKSRYTALVQKYIMIILIRSHI